MKSISKLIAFILVNILGFLSVVICYFIGISSGMLASDQPNFDIHAFKLDFLAGTLITWLICAVFSLAYFFMKGKERLLFLWAPFVVPMIYGLSVLTGSLSP